MLYLCLIRICRSIQSKINAKPAVSLQRVATTPGSPTTDDVTDATSPSGRRQYVTLRRQRPTTSTSVEEEKEEEPGRRRYVGNWAG